MVPLPLANPDDSSLLNDNRLRCDDMGPLSISPHVVAQRRADGAYIAYHSLFGNLSVLDAELADSLAALRGASGSFESFANALGADVARALFGAYYLAAAHEERAIAQTWLAERRAAAPSGRYLGGLQITSSNACNFSCGYCFADSSDRRSPERQAGAETINVSFDVACDAIDKVLDTARRHGKKRIGVKFLGREPLVNFRVIDRLLDRYSTDEVAWSLTTNGSLVTDAIARRLAAVGARVVVSIDGPPETNDVLRVVKSSSCGTQSAHALAVRGVQALVTAGAHASVSAVLSSRTNFATMPDFLATVRELGCRELEFTLAMQTVTLRAQSRFADAAGLANSLATLYAQARELGLFVSGDWIEPFHAIIANHKFRDEALMARPQGVKCQATEHQLSLEPNGDFFPCRAMSFHYGNLSRWEDVLASEAYRQVVMRTYFAVPACHGCALEGHCQGTCLGSLEEASGDIYSPQAHYCTVYRETTNLLLQQMT